MYLSDRHIKELMARLEDPLRISPYSEERLTPNGYDVSIEVVDKEGKMLADKEYEIAPGELIRVKSIETLEVPSGYIGFMLLRSRFTRQGLLGLFGVIDSGFKGKIHASIKNLSDSPIQIKLDEGVIHMVLATMSSESQVPYGTAHKHHWQHQK
ncbi:MAG: hypothetical protein KGH61_03755 [Candidatus Micrarchaeota archaeon]|nr:hypothetical protein [Candidatus Micrarchaeota archaeon]MDE1848036.1 hypothetical protein [Candidatus Micrarchaeota archaeon]MDE1864733.1 hypothetical protein [Candidatus Micrarchaeota archaeon]